MLRQAALAVASSALRRVAAASSALRPAAVASSAVAWAWGLSQRRSRSRRRELCPCLNPCALASPGSRRSALALLLLFFVAQNGAVATPFHQSNRLATASDWFAFAVFRLGVVAMKMTESTIIVQEEKLHCNDMSGVSKF